MKYLIPTLLAAVLLFFGVRFLINQEEFLPDQQPELPTIDSTAVNPVEEPALLEEEKIDLVKEDGYYRIDWQLLAKVDFEERFNDEMADYIFYPIFHPEVTRLEGEQVIIKGYVIPFEETGSEELIILSAFPFSECFFCGNAGPESVMDIQLSKPLSDRIKQDAEMEFRGKLHLNDSDLYYLNYMLLDAAPLDD